MDAAGAEKLRWRIEQQQHWRYAEAVLDGRQPSVDPDLAELEEFGEGLRIYSPRLTRNGRARVCKRLIKGVWELGMVDEGLDPDGAASVQVA